MTPPFWRAVSPSSEWRGPAHPLEDGDVTICESGAIVEYILERYGNGRLAPPIGSPLRGEFLQWVHFAESTTFSPIGVIVWHTLFERNADRFPEVIESYAPLTDEKASISCCLTSWH